MRVNILTLYLELNPIVIAKMGCFHILVKGPGISFWAKWGFAIFWTQFVLICSRTTSYLDNKLIMAMQTRI